MAFGYDDLVEMGMHPEDLRGTGVSGAPGYKNMNLEAIQRIQQLQKSGALPKSGFHNLNAGNTVGGVETLVNDTTKTLPKISNIRTALGNIPWKANLKNIGKSSMYGLAAEGVNNAVSNALTPKVIGDDGSRSALAEGANDVAAGLAGGLLPGAYKGLAVVPGLVKAGAAKAGLMASGYDPRYAQDIDTKYNNMIANKSALDAIRAKDKAIMNTPTVPGNHGINPGLTADIATKLSTGSLPETRKPLEENYTTTDKKYWNDPNHEFVLKGEGTPLTPEQRTALADKEQARFEKEQNQAKRDAYINDIKSNISALQKPYVPSSNELFNMAVHSTPGSTTAQNAAPYIAAHNNMMENRKKALEGYMTLAGHIMPEEFKELSDNKKEKSKALEQAEINHLNAQSTQQNAQAKYYDNQIMSKKDMHDASIASQREKEYARMVENANKEIGPKRESALKAAEAYKQGLRYKQISPEVPESGWGLWKKDKVPAMYDWVNPSEYNNPTYNDYKIVTR